MTVRHRFAKKRRFVLTQTRYNYISMYGWRNMGLANYKFNFSSQTINSDLIGLPTVTCRGGGSAGSRGKKKRRERKKKSTPL